MRKDQQVLGYSVQRSASNFIVKCSVAALLGLLFLGITLGTHAGKAQARSLTPSVNLAPLSSQAPPVGSGNYFPYGSCTWWANQRYHQLHGVYVPWRTQSNAWQWTARAYQFGWHVSSTPTVGSIIDLQPWVQGAYGLGHVGVVEQILQGGRVLTSNMSWGPYPWQVTYVQFTPGPGVTFISW